jgi:hypothetical protein
MEDHLTTAAKNQLKRSDYDRLGRVTQAHHRRLEEAANHIELFPILVLRFHQHQHQVGAD